MFIIYIFIFSYNSWYNWSYAMVLKNKKNLDKTVADEE
jgi:hypothetical protein